MDRGVCWATVLGVSKRWTWLSDWILILSIVWRKIVLFAKKYARVHSCYFSGNWLWFLKLWSDSFLNIIKIILPCCAYFHYAFNAFGKILVSCLLISSLLSLCFKLLQPDLQFQWPIALLTPIKLLLHLKSVAHYCGYFTWGQIFFKLNISHCSRVRVLTTIWS